MAEQSYPPVSFDDALKDAMEKVTVHDQVYADPPTPEQQAKLRAADVACFNLVRWYGHRMTLKP